VGQGLIDDGDRRRRTHGGDTPRKTLGRPKKTRARRQVAEQNKSMGERPRLFFRFDSGSGGASMRSIGIDWKNEKRTEKKPNKGISKQAEAAGPRERRYAASSAGR